MVHDQSFGRSFGHQTVQTDLKMKRKRVQGNLLKSYNKRSHAGTLNLSNVPAVKAVAAHYNQTGKDDLLGEETMEENLSHDFPKLNSYLQPKPLLEQEGTASSAIICASTPCPLAQPNHPPLKSESRRDELIKAFPLPSIESLTPLHIQGLPTVSTQVDIFLVTN